MLHRTPLVGLPALLAATLFTAGCGDVLGPEPDQPEEVGAPAPAAVAAEPARITGSGTLGEGTATPGSPFQDFEFDVSSDLTGRLFFRDWGVVRESGRPGTITVDPAADTATKITAYRNGSTACVDDGTGVEFEGIGRLDTGELYSFIARACDQGPAGSGDDYFGIVLPDRPYERGNSLSSGDIVKSASEQEPEPDVTIDLTGNGTLGSGTATPGSSLQDFDFDVGSDSGGQLLYHDWAVVRPDGTVATVTVDSTDGSTGITSVRDGSAVCADSALGAEFDGTGRLDTGELVGFTVRVCDAGPADSGADYFEISVPSHSYTRGGALSSGDIVKTTTETEPEPTTGDLTVAAATAGAELDADGYTVTVDGAASQTVGANGSVTFSALAAGDHSVALSGVAENCTVAGTSPRTVNVPAGGTVTSTFEVTCEAVAERLEFTVQPSNAAPGETIEPAVQVTAVDASGNRVSSFTGTVRIAIGQNGGGWYSEGTLSGTTSVATVDGVATFSDLSIDEDGDDYTLVAGADGLTGTESEDFDIVEDDGGSVCLLFLCLL